MNIFQKFKRTSTTAIVNEKGQAIALANCPIPPYNISYNSYFFKACISLAFLLLLSIPFIFAPNRAWHVEPALSFTQLVKKPVFANDIINIWNFFIIFIILLGTAAFLFSMWQSFDFLNRSKIFTVFFSSKQDTPLGYRILYFRDASTESLFSALSSIKVWNDVDLSFLQKDKAYKVFGISKNIEKTRLIILDEIEFEKLTKRLKHRNI